MSALAYINGEFLPMDEARVSVEDRGFLFGDGIYEVVVAYQGEPFRMAEHLARLKRSAQAINLTLPHSTQETKRIVGEGIQRSGFQHTKIYMQITRGVAPRTHAFPAHTKPTFVAIFREKGEVPPQIRQTGVRVITTEEIRWAKCYIKSVGLLPNVLAAQSAAEAGAFEALFVTPDGVVKEGSASNVFIVTNGKVVTPAKNETILHGVTRGAVLECVQKLGLEALEESLSLEELLTADEVFLTGTATEVLGVVQVDERTIGEGRVGPVTQRIYESFRELISP